MFESRYAHRNISQNVSHYVSHPVGGTADFTRTARELVAANDRAARRAEQRRRLRTFLTRRLQAAGLLWSALALSAVVLSWSVVPLRVQ